MSKASASLADVIRMIVEVKAAEKERKTKASTSLADVIRMIVKATAAEEERKSKAPVSPSVAVIQTLIEEALIAVNAAEEESKALISPSAEMAQALIELSAMDALKDYDIIMRMLPRALFSDDVCYEVYRFFFWYGKALAFKRKMSIELGSNRARAIIRPAFTESAETKRRSENENNRQLLELYIHHRVPVQQLARELAKDKRRSGEFGMRNRTAAAFEQQLKRLLNKDPDTEKLFFMRPLLREAQRVRLALGAKRGRPRKNK